MTTELNQTAILSEILADAEAVIAAVMARRKVDPKIAQRVRERAQKVTEEIYRKHGMLDIGTPAIRELRDE